MSTPEKPRVVHTKPPRKFARKPVVASNDRLRISVDARYIEALGRAIYVFAILEWAAVWCCERMEAGFIHKMGREKMTAGDIATELVRLAAKRPEQDRSDCLGPALQFQRLVEARNRIVHGKPGTAPSGGQSLFRDGEQWTLNMLNDAADEFAACSFPLNALLYNQLR